MVPYPVPILPLVPIFHSFTYSYNLSNLIELPLIYSRAQLVELERMYECVRIAPNRPKIQVYKNIINHKFIFNYHYNSAHWSDRLKLVAIKDPRTAGDCRGLLTSRSERVRPGSCLVETYLEIFLMKLREFLEEIKKVYGIFRRGWM